MKTNKNYMRGELVDSEIGNKKTDSEGSPVCGVRMDASRAYADIPELLQKVIDEDDDAAWAVIIHKIDYIYDQLDISLGSLDRETGFISEVLKHIKSGKKLLFKPNLVGTTSY